ncbi:hypothetical protein [Enterococcus mundtii]|uniref:hypothetical protein n=1 Tax=Enterococcus mundtii TaxID=53346 RepID=UPI0010BE69C3|nr:hypothetical protein [Enterococcus mundtii]QCJ56124.1 hypothetical protein DDJ96_05675 [Enterococcus mundtii]
MKYRKRPAIVEAVQFTPSDSKNWRECYEFIGGFSGERNFIDETWREKNRSERTPCVSTGDGIKQLTNKDYIVKDVFGNFHIYKPDVFET